MAKDKKFSFGKILMEAPEITDSVPRVTILKSGQMVIPRAVHIQFGFDGMAVELVWDDQKRAFGMKRIMTEYESAGWNHKTMRLLKIDPKSGQMRVSVGRVMKKIGLGKIDFKQLPLEVYNDILEDKSIYYVILNKKSNASIRPERVLEAEVAGQ